jgi:hypothetical protein
VSVSFLLYVQDRTVRTCSSFFTFKIRSDFTSNFHDTGVQEVIEILRLVSFKALKSREFVPWRNFARKICLNYSDCSIIFLEMSALNVILLVCLSLVMLLQGNANQFLPAQCNSLSKHSSLQKVLKIRGGMQVTFSCRLICTLFC